MKEKNRPFMHPHMDYIIFCSEIGVYMMSISEYFLLFMLDLYQKLSSNNMKT